MQNYPLDSQIDLNLVTGSTPNLSFLVRKDRMLGFSPWLSFKTKASLAPLYDSSIFPMLESSSYKFLCGKVAVPFIVFYYSIITRCLDGRW